MRYAVSLVVAGRPPRRVVELWVDGVPDEVTSGEVRIALEGSEYAGRLSTSGIFMANRKIQPENRLRGPVEAAPTATTVSWATLVQDERKQLNFRVYRSERARWEAAARAVRAPDLSAWIRDTLNAAAAGVTTANGTPRASAAPSLTPTPPSGPTAAPAPANSRPASVKSGDQATEATPRRRRARQSGAPAGASSGDVSTPAS